MIWWRRTRISASRRALERNSPVGAPHSNLSRGIIGHEHHPIRAGSPGIEFPRRTTIAAKLGPLAQARCECDVIASDTVNACAYYRFDAHRRFAINLSEEHHGQIVYWSSNCLPSIRLFIWTAASCDLLQRSPYRATRCRDRARSTTSKASCQFLQSRASLQRFSNQTKICAIGTF